MENGLLTVADNSTDDGRGVFLSKGDHQYALNVKASQITLGTATYPYRLEKKELIIDTGAAWGCSSLYLQTRKITTPWQLFFALTKNHTTNETTDIICNVDCCKQPFAHVGLLHR